VFSTLRGLRRRRTIVVPLLEPEQAPHALDLACRLASDGSQVLVLAPLFVEWELPLDAHFKAEEAQLAAELDAERALVERYGIRAHGEIVRARHGQLGRAVADVAQEVGASLVVLGTVVESRRDFRRPFSRDVCSVVQDAPCPVLIATGVPEARVRAVV
jgi:nucleotide-binding universal stress UspA family protein